MIKHQEIISLKQISQAKISQNVNVDITYPSVTPSIYSSEAVDPIIAIPPVEIDEMRIKQMMLDIKCNGFNLPNGLTYGKLKDVLTLIKESTGAIDAYCSTKDVDCNCNGSPEFIIIDKIYIELSDGKKIPFKEYDEGRRYVDISVTNKISLKQCIPDD